MLYLYNIQPLHNILTYIHIYIYMCINIYIYIYTYTLSYGIWCITSSNAQIQLTRHSSLCVSSSLAHLFRLLSYYDDCKYLLRDFRVHIAVYSLDENFVIINFVQEHPRMRRKVYAPLLEDSIPFSSTEDSKHLQR